MKQKKYIACILQDASEIWNDKVKTSYYYISLKATNKDEAKSILKKIIDLNQSIGFIKVVWIKSSNEIKKFILKKVNNMKNNDNLFISADLFTHIYTNEGLTYMPLSDGINKKSDMVIVKTKLK